MLPVVILAAAFSDAAPRATEVRLILLALPITIPFNPVWWHFTDMASDSSWRRVVLLWVAATILPATALGTSLWFLAS